MAKLQQEVREEANRHEEMEKKGKEKVWQLECEVQRLEDSVQEWKEKHGELQIGVSHLRDTFHRK